MSDGNSVTWSELLVHAGYDQEKADCICAAFDAAGIITVVQLDNSPVKLGTSVCGEDLFQVISRLREVFATGIEYPLEPESEVADRDSEEGDSEVPALEV